MSSPTDPSTVTCRYWATSGTCFFGDQCNFSHSLEERGNVAKSGAVPKKEKACRNLLLTGYCKDENSGCEYNHDIVGITRTEPPSSAQSNASKAPATSAAPPVANAAPASSPKKPGTPGSSSLAQSLQVRSVLPASAPAFVPAAVAAAQRAALNAWGGLTPGKGGAGDGAASPASGQNGPTGEGAEQKAKEGQEARSGEDQKVALHTSSSSQNANSVNASTSSAPGTPRGSTSSQPPLSVVTQLQSASTSALTSTLNAPSTSRLPANVNAAPFVPRSSASSIPPTSTAVPSRIANVNAAPYVPNSTATPYQRSKSSPSPGLDGFNPVPNQVRGEGTMSPRFAGGLAQGQGAMNSPRGMTGAGGMAPFDMQRRQMSQFHQQALHQQQQHGVRGRGANLPHYAQQNHDRQFPGPTAFGLPEGDDPALGMSSMSPPHARGHFEGGQSNHRLQDAMTAMKMSDAGGRYSANHRSLSALGMMSPRDDYHSRTPPIPGLMQNTPPVSPLKQQLGRATPPLQNQAYGRARPGVDRSGMQPFGPRSNSPSLVPAAATQVGGATYFFGPGQGAVPPQMGPGGHLAPAGGFGLGPGRPHRTVIRPGAVQLASRFMAESLREELQQRAALVQAQIDPEQDISDLPEFVGRYHTLYPLESGEADGASSLGVRTTVFKGISSTDGQAYAIRRIDHRQVIPTAELANAANEAIERWSHLSGHPHMGVMREAFVSKEIEDSAALYFAYDYYPGAVSLETAHLQQEQSGGVVHLTVTEDQLWSYTIQLATALRAIHGAGLICRGGALDASKVLITSRGRIRLCAVGFLDVLHGDPGEDKQFLQRIDLAEMGRLLLCLACGSAMNASLDFMAAHYPPELVRITQALIASSPENHEVGGLASVKQLTSVLGDRMFSELEHSHVYSDQLMDDLEKEAENGRLLRIMIKSSMINERPDDDVAESNWSETGDRYLLKLFRDFVFHQSTEEGKPSMDWGHIIEALNKLDAGVPEKVTLLSRDEQSLLVASYKDLKRCLDGTYGELQAKASGTKRRPSYQTNPLLIASQAMGVTGPMGLR